ncbi:Uroporphyrinogen decarboxylase [Sporomusa silvacetica DSM 10669]|uniref:Uroporphyrinogen decarboxylase n=1 Tax=Sporomusa silvacetica DSM 10669 TaxID=1123289 RepID=A0ABZ3IPX9_9FIRM|nr:uroporphyrinogen decarboxylase family protein [Sporomusa silvacetica]OZC19894.1 uroporphyrinogen decarboxylase [Sporomusa silvacetica DSM 10669]
MARDTMTAEERLMATINLQPVDRIVCAPETGNYAGQYAGITNKEFVWEFETKGLAAIEKLATDYPMWDCSADINGITSGYVAERAGMGKMKLPGKELDDNAASQVIETEVMSRDDYAIVKDKGFGEYQLTFLERANNISREDVIKGIAESGRIRAVELAAIRNRGQAPIYGDLGGLVPFDAFSLTRSIEKYYKDMFQIPDQLEELFPMLVDAFVEGAQKTVAATGVNRVFVGGSRSAGQFISKRYFDRLVWPYFQELVDKLAAKDIVPILHFDCDWIKNLEYFLELPKGKFVLELDGSTDIFKAKEILNGHCAIHGDVPAAYLTIASPSELDEYCQKLIKTVGKGGGFLYACGCCMPMNAKHANVKVFFEAVEKYGYY